MMILRPVFFLLALCAAFRSSGEAQPIGKAAFTDAPAADLDDTTDPTTTTTTTWEPNPTIERVTGNQPMRDLNSSITDDAVKCMLLGPEDKYLYTAGGVSGLVNVWNVAYLTKGHGADGADDTTTTTTTLFESTKWVAATLRAEIAHLDSLDPVEYDGEQVVFAKDAPYNITLIGTFEHAIGVRINAMALGPNGTLFTGGDDGIIKVFNGTDRRMNNKDSKMQIQSGSKIDVLQLNSNGETLYGGGTLGPVSSPSTAAAQLAKGMSGKLASKASSVSGDLPAEDQGKNGATAADEDHHPDSGTALKDGEAGGDEAKEQTSLIEKPLAGSDSHADYMHGWIRSWDVSGIKKYSVIWRDQENGKPGDNIPAPKKMMDVRQGTEVFALQLTEDGKYAITGGDDGMVTQWDLKDYSVIRDLNHGGVVQTIAVDTKSSGDTFIISGGRKGQVSVWNMSAPADADDEQQLIENLGHGAVVSELLVRGNDLFSAGWAGTSDDPQVKRERGADPPVPTDVGIIKAFNIADYEGGRRELKYSFPQGNWVNSLAMTSDNKWMFAGGNEGTIVAWNMAKYDTKKDAMSAIMKGGADKLWEAVTPAPTQANGFGAEDSEPTKEPEDTALSPESQTIKPASSQPQPEGEEQENQPAEKDAPASFAQVAVNSFGVLQQK